MDDILTRCETNYGNEPCCHTDGRDCNCNVCLTNGFHGSDPDTYGCLKKLSCYVMNYGPSYSSEIYNYLKQSQILERHFLNKDVKILSLGCGICSDKIAVQRYIDDQNLPVTFQYRGFDVENQWGQISGFGSPEFRIRDVIQNPPPLHECDIVFINKLFSTLQSTGLHLDFLDKFSTAMMPTLRASKFLIYNDVNSIYKGREIFDNKITPLVSSVERYFFDIRDAYAGGNYTRIENNLNVFSIPEGLSINPARKVTQTVFFQYKK